MEEKVVLNEIISNSFASNTYVVSNDKVAYIFDAGASLEKVIGVIKDKEVLGVFITHAHFDHILNVKKYVEHFKTKLYISSNGAEKLDDENKNLGCMFNIKVDAKGIGNIEIVKDGQQFEADDIVIKCCETPGHSNCSISYVVNNQYAIVGDVLFFNTVGRYDLYDSNYVKLVHSVKLLKSLDVVKYFPGHDMPFLK